MFSLLVVLNKHADELARSKPAELKETLEDAADDLPEEYLLAAREGVNNKKERTACSGSRVSSACPLRATADKLAVYFDRLPNVFGTPGRLWRFIRVREPLVPFSGLPAFECEVFSPMPPGSDPAPSRTAFRNA
jgi:hypothetical protein